MYNMNVQKILLVATVLSAVLIVPAIGQYDVCNLCGYPGATLSNPSLLLDVSALGISGVQSVSCDQILAFGLTGGISPSNCTLLQEQKESQIQCGCTPPPGTIVFNPTSAPISSVDPRQEVTPTASSEKVICNVCNNDPSATISNPTLLLDVSQLNDQIQNATCEQIVTAGLSSFFTAEQCTTITSDPRAIDSFAKPCGCSTYSLDAIVPTQVPGSAPITQAPFSTTDSLNPVCNMCLGNSTATLDNPNKIVDVSFLGTAFVNVQCSQLYDTALAGFLDPTICSLLQSNTTILIECGCTNVIDTDVTVGPSMSPTTSTLPPVEASDTVGTIIEKKRNLSILNLAIQAANISDVLNDFGTILTVFGPIDAAFEQSSQSEYLYKLVQEPDYILHLISLLSFHVVLGSKPVSDFPFDNVDIGTETLYGDNITLSRDSTTVDNRPITVSYDAFDGTVEVATVLVTNFTAANGIVYTIDTVLLPSFIFTNLNTFLITEFDDFTIFPELFALAFPNGLPSRKYTVFAPNDAAFIDTLGQVAIDNLKDPVALNTLTTILTYHIVQDIYSTIQLQDGQQIISLGNVTITTTIDANATFMFNDANTIAQDVLVSDGVVHIIDKILLPVTDVVTETPTISPSLTLSPTQIIDVPSNTPSDIPSITPSITLSPTLDDMPTGAPSRKEPTKSSVRKPSAARSIRNRAGDNNNNNNKVGLFVHVNPFVKEIEERQKFLETTNDNVSDELRKRKNRRRFNRHHKLIDPIRSTTTTSTSTTAITNDGEKDDNDNNNKPVPKAKPVNKPKPKPVNKPKPKPVLKPKPKPVTKSQQKPIRKPSSNDNN